MADKIRIKEPFVKLTISGSCCDKILHNGQVFYWREGNPVPPVCVELAPQLSMYLYHFAQGGREIDGGNKFRIECPDRRNNGKPCVVIDCEIIQL
ncbi:hypothetical protein IKG50_02820 [Candidatus Saccharibacteria bacterium]|nr:hypothetical protein [Candidatus Saccharibacteria bacterium]